MVKGAKFHKKKKFVFVFILGDSALKFLSKIYNIDLYGVHVSFIILRIQQAT